MVSTVGVPFWPFSYSTNTIVYFVYFKHGSHFLIIHFFTMRAYLFSKIIDFVCFGSASLLGIVDDGLVKRVREGMGKEEKWVYPVINSVACCKSH